MRKTTPHGAPRIQRVGEEASSRLGIAGHREPERRFQPKQAGMPNQTIKQKSAGLFKSIITPRQANTQTNQNAKTGKQCKLVNIPKPVNIPNP